MYGILMQYLPPQKKKLKIFKVSSLLEKTRIGISEYLHTRVQQGATGKGSHQHSSDQCKSQPKGCFTALPSFHREEGALVQSKA